MKKTIITNHYIKQHYNLKNYILYIMYYYIPLPNIGLLLAVTLLI
jgi:hypothetical protein